MEIAEQVNLGFSTADAEDVEYSYSEGSATIKFQDWQEKSISVLFTDVLAIKWQEADTSTLHERDDETYEIINSEWLGIHSKQNFTDSNVNYHHYKLCFNACIF